MFGDVPDMIRVLEDKLRARTKAVVRIYILYDFISYKSKKFEI